MTLDLLALARETYLGTEDSEQHWIAFGNAIIERCAVVADARSLKYRDGAHGLGAAAARNCACEIRSMKAPTP